VIRITIQISRKEIILLKEIEMMKKWVGGVLSAVVLVGMGSVAEATLLMQDDFEGVTATSVYPVTNGTTYYPDSAKWLMQNQDSKSIAVYTDATAGSQVLCLQKASSSVPMIKTDFTRSQKAVLSFDLYVPSSNQNQRTLNLNLQDASNAANVRTASYLAINNGSNGWGICSIAGGVWTTIVTPKVDEWVPVTINADAISKTFTLTYAGATYDNNGNGYQFFDWGDGLAFNRLFISQSGVGLTTRIDNVKVTDGVPEPMTIGLFVIGGLGTLLRKRVA
jgi:hypothetical protein